MANTPTTTMRLDPKLKSDALEVLRPMGLNLSSAVDIFLRAVVRENGLPFEMKKDKKLAVGNGLERE